MIRFAIEEDLDRIKELWNESFNYDDFAKWYFENIFDIDNVLVYELDNEVVAALQRIPYHIKGIGEATYIYGASTAKEHRNKGIMSKLLAYSEILDMASGVDAIFLVPENEALFTFYEKKGYNNYFYKYSHDNYKVNNQNDGQYLSLIDISKKNKLKWDEFALDMIDVYIKANGNSNYIIRNQKMFVSQISMHVETGGTVYAFYNNKNNQMIGYAFGYVEENVFEISELALYNMTYYVNATELLKKKMGYLKVLNLLNGNIKVKYGCIKMLQKSLNVNKIIINLVYD